MNGIGWRDNKENKDHNMTGNIKEETKVAAGNIKEEKKAATDLSLSPYKFQAMRRMTLELVLDSIRVRKGDVVLTPFGKGEVIAMAAAGASGSSGGAVPQSFEIRLDCGATLYSPVDNSQHIHKCLSSDEFGQAMDNLEQLRKLQIIKQCQQEWKVPVPPNENACVACSSSRRKCVANNNKENNRPVYQPRRRNNWYTNLRTNVSTDNDEKKNKKKSRLPRCDVCGNPVCQRHTTPGTAENFTICVDCSTSVLHEVEHQLNPHHPNLQANLERLLLIYIRCQIQLACYVPYTTEVVRQITAKQRGNAQIALGTSGLGFVGACLGVAGAMSLMTPAGPAVLLAACVTSATSGTLQLTHQGYDKFLSCQQANQLADRIIGWQRVCLGILSHLERLRQDLLAEQQILLDNQRREERKLGYGKPWLSSCRYLKNNYRSSSSLDKNADLNTLAARGFTTSRHAMNGVGVTQALTTGLQGIPVVGAAFSVGCMAMDARNMTSALKNLQKPTSNKTIALRNVERSFAKQTPNWIQDEVEALFDAIHELRERQAEQRREQELAIEARDLGYYLVNDIDL